jgi:hypothetical protein
LFGGLKSFCSHFRGRRLADAATAGQPDGAERAALAGELQKRFGRKSGMWPASAYPRPGPVVVRSHSAVGRSVVTNSDSVSGAADARGKIHRWAEMKRLTFSKTEAGSLKNELGLSSKFERSPT